MIDPELPPVLANHITAVLVSQLSAWPVVAAGVRQILRSVVTRGLPVGRSNDGTVVIHPGAGKAEKCWPVERFVKLVEKLKHKRTPVRVLLGETELEKWPADAIEKISKAAEVHKPETYLDLLNQIVSGSVFVGNDSGPAAPGGNHRRADGRAIRQFTGSMETDRPACEDRASRTHRRDYPARCRGGDSWVRKTVERQAAKTPSSEMPGKKKI